jgi:uncharacterized protein Veg
LNIDIIKNKIIDLKNHNLKIKVNLGRNKYEFLEGKIDKIHPNIFTVHTNKGIRTYSYSDVATKVVTISKF